MSRAVSGDEIQVNGVVYNIKEFSRKHPGGNIISFYAGRDATLVWNEFHYRSEKARKVIDALPSVTGKLEEDPVAKDFVKLREDLVKEGFFEPSYGHIAYRVIELVLMHYVGFYLLSHGWPLLGIIIFSIANGRCGWLMHEAGHASFTTNVKLDKIIQSITFGLGNGMSGAYWNNQHNKHHACPQKLGFDIDLNTLPLVAFHKIIARNGPAWWLRYQAYLFPLLTTTIVTFSWALYFHPRYILRRRNILEFLCYLLRWLFVIKYLTLPLFILNAAIGGLYIFLNFALSHTHKDIIADVDVYPNWVQFAINYTTNIRGGPLIDWWMGYLNYQIEHHLFPQMPQFRHAQVAKRVKKLAEKHGLKYDLRTYNQALNATFKNLNDIGSSL